MLRNILLIFALMAMLPLQNFAQNNEKTYCFEEQSVFEILENLRSKDAEAVADAEETLYEMAKMAGYTGDSQMRDVMRNTVVPYVEKFSGINKAQFLVSLVPLFCTVDDVPALMQLSENEKLADYVIRAIGDINGTAAYILKYITRNPDNLNNKAAWAYAVGKQEIKSLENELISWLRGADDQTKIDVYNALLVIRSNEKTTKIIEKGAKKLNKSKVPENKIAGMRLLVALNGEKTLPILYKALQNTDKYVRVEALNLIKPFANQEVVNNVVKKCKKEAAKIDVVRWLGEIKNDSQMALVISLLSSEDSEAVQTAIRAIYKIDNPDGINAVKPMFGGSYQEVIKESLIAYGGNYRLVLDDILKNGDDDKKLAALKVLEARPEVELSVRVKELVYSNNKNVRDEAFKVLPLVVIQPHAEFLKELIGACDDEYVEYVQLALKNAMKNAPEGVKDNFVSLLKYVGRDIMPRYYKVFAYFGTELCVDKLIEASISGPDSFEAKEALLLVDDDKFADKINEALK